MTKKVEFLAVSTFPDIMFNVYGGNFLSTYREFMPKSIPIALQLDDSRIVNNKEMNKQVMNECANNQEIKADYVCHTFEDNQLEFFTENKEKDDKKDYKKQCVRFSHKIFALDRVCRQLSSRYLIWMDADIEFTAPITEEFIKSLIPEGKVVSYLGRRDHYATESSFLIFDLENGGLDFIQAMLGKYLSGEIYNFPEWTDSFVFDVVLAEFNKVNNKDVGHNLTEGIEGMDIFPKSPLAPYMMHFKGPEAKHKLAEKHGALKPQSSNIDVNNMNIQTKNCVQDDIIKDNVSMNLRLIDNWMEICKETEEEIVVCSAGPSLEIDKVLEFYDRGVKVVAVKHAIEPLMKAGIKPWAVILLDPRPHVANFIEYPDKDINYFVASMVDPKVTDHLIKNGCKVYGYHALVGAGEEERIPRNHILIQGGSATATRGIGILEGLGFRKMHLFGYDCCYFEKPDLNETKENGKLRYSEATLSVTSWAGKKLNRTFWTEGQFLAQVNEFSTMYFPKSHIEYKVYGDGIIPWMFKHMEKEKAYGKYLRNKQGKQISDYPDVNESVNDEEYRQGTKR